MPRSQPEALQWMVMPSPSGTAGSTITGGGNTVSVRVVNAQGAPIPSYTQTVSLMINYNSVALGGSINLIGGGPATPDPTTAIATFPRLSISPAGTYNLVAYVQTTTNMLNYMSVPSDPFVLT